MYKSETAPTPSDTGIGVRHSLGSNLRIAHLGADNIFVSRWANSQVSLGHEVHLITQQLASARSREFTTHVLPFAAPLGYYLNALTLRKRLREIKPDLLHVHYATGYGTLGRLASFSPSILSMWGSDVMVEPLKSSSMRALVSKNLRHYDWLCSTSHVMAHNVRSLYSDLPSVSITPIGVDSRVFSPPEGLVRKDWITITTVKALLSVYGIDLLLKAFSEARAMLLADETALASRLRLVIAGSGPEEHKLKSLASELGISDRTNFLGHIAHDQVADLLRETDIFVALSRSESFGVAVIEASACQVPVLVSNVGGLPEVVLADQTGLIVARENWRAAADALVRLIKDEVLRRRLGEAGRKFVQANYEWEDCVGVMENIYQQVMARRRRLSDQPVTERRSSSKCER